MATTYKQNKNFACEIFHVTIEQLEEFGWRAFNGKKEDYIVKFLIITLNEYGITNKTEYNNVYGYKCAESNFGIDNIEE